MEIHSELRARRSDSALSAQPVAEAFRQAQRHPDFINESAIMGI